MLNRIRLVGAVVICLLGCPFTASADECRFASQTSSTSLPEYFEMIKHALSGPELNRYYLSCGVFIQGQRYYDDLLTPESRDLLTEIRGIKNFKDIALSELRGSERSGKLYVEIVEVAGNWKDDRRFASVLIRSLSHPDPDIRIAAAHSLRDATTPYVLHKLVRMLNSRRPAVRHMAALALDGTRSPEARSALMKLRQDPDPGFRAQAIVGTL